jgi:hypothetical protein
MTKTATRGGSGTLSATAAATKWSALEVRGRKLSSGDHGWGGGGFMGGDAVEQLVEVGTGESPVEGLGGGVVAVSEGQHPLGEGIQTSHGCKLSRAFLLIFVWCGVG